MSLQLNFVLSNEAGKVYQELREKAADGLTVGEFIGAIQSGVSHLVKQAAGFAVAGPLKKEAVTVYALSLFDLLAPLVRIPWVPRFATSLILGFVRDSIPHVIEAAYAAIKPYLETQTQ